MADHLLNVALAQIAPAWLDKKQTIKRIENQIKKAAKSTVTDRFWRRLIAGISFLVGIDGWS